MTMKKVLTTLALTLVTCSPSFGQARSFVYSAPSNGNAGFAPPNAYGYAGSYTGGAGYSSNFGYNTIRPGNMPFVPGYYSGIPGTPYPNTSFGVPQPYGMPGQAYYTISYGGRPVRFWQSPSGYFYPWVTGYNAPIVYIPTAGQSPQPTAPPISTICKDLLSYLEEQKDKGNLSEDAYVHLKQRATDIRKKERDLRISGNGAVDSQDEVQMRRDLEGLGAEVAKSVSSS
jgi:hypothetical protein